MFGLFKHKEKLLKDPVDLSVLHTDVHSHLIPGVDDGAQNIDDSLSLLKGLQELGYKKAIITPHILYYSFPEGISVLDEKLAYVKQEAAKEGIDMELEVAGEFMLDDDISERVEKKEIKTFGQKKYLLFEFPISTEPTNYADWLFNLQCAGFNLVLAHPERYRYFYMFDKTKYEEIKDRGVLFQINLMSLSGYYGEVEKQAAEYLISEGMVDLVGSDCHKQRHIEAIKRSLYSPALKQLIESGKLLNSKL